MIEEFPGNSRINRPALQPEHASEKPKVEPVITGKVVHRKPSLGRRFVKTFFSGDSDSVFGYITREVLVPALQNLVSDMVTQGVQRAVWGDRAPTRPTTYNGSSANRTHVSYNRFAGPTTPPAAPAARRYVAPSDVVVDEVVLETREDADAVLDGLFERIDQYNAVSVADLKTMLGESPSYTDHKFGWVDLSNIAAPRRIANGWLIVFPPSIDLK